MDPSSTTRPGVDSALAGLPSIPTALALFSLRGRVAIVTGAHRGIGLEFALALAEAGAVVYCVDLPQEPDADWQKVQAYAATMECGRLEYIQCDVTSQDATWAMAEAIVKREGRLDICIANAGVLHSAKCLEYSAEDFKKVHEVNVAGVLYTAQAAGRQMVKLGLQGSIVLTASIGGSINLPGQDLIAYNTSKSAVLQMARSMACELASSGIRVNSISPGYIITEMTREGLLYEAALSAQNPLRRFGRTDELRGVALWLASDASSFCTGSDIKVDGGQCAW
ncbi:sorbose reductase sou1 [Mycena amicta]|nr:sorbose reductase sou1 [Mycena amicta]